MYVSVTYDANKGTGTVPKVQAEEKGKPVYLSGGESLSRADYKFTGWNTKQTGDGQFYDAGVKYTANETVTLYAVWTPIPKYTVTYYANGGSGAVPASQTKVEDVSLRLSNKGKLSLADHVFIGWNTLANGNGVTYFERDLYTENAKLDLYAMWRKNDAEVFAITYDGNGATSGTPPSDQPKVEDAIVTLATKGTLAKDGHIFICWNTQADGKGTSYAESAKYTENKDITLYAMWQESSGAQTYTVTYKCKRWNRNSS